MKTFKSSLILILISICQLALAQELSTPFVNSVLYKGVGENQPLVVGLGGSEGGNVWASNYWKKTREEFTEKGYAFLALGYFGAKGTPVQLDRIDIEKVHDAILAAIKDPQINGKKIAIIGGSRGGDLALLLGSYYTDIKCVVALVASNVTFPANTQDFSTPSWSYKGKDLPFVPVNELAVPYLMKHELRKAFEAMLQDSVSCKEARIKVEKINGPILLLSANNDEICPSTPMSEKMMAELRSSHFHNHFEHISFSGSHSEPLKHFDVIFNFLEKYFK